MVPVRICPSRIASQKDVFSVRVLMDAVLEPPPKQVVQYEVSCLTTAPNGDVTLVSLQIINAVWDDFAFREVLVIVVVYLNRPTAITPAIAVEITQALFLLTIDTQHRAPQTHP